MLCDYRDKPDPSWDAHGGSNSLEKFFFRLIVGLSFNSKLVGMTRIIAILFWLVSALCVYAPHPRTSHIPGDSHIPSDTFIVYRFSGQVF